MAPIPTVAAPSLRLVSISLYRLGDDLHDKEPSPTGDTVDSVELQKSSRNETSESVTELLEEVKTCKY
jgi:hypothetical protein